jgi:hypothetical protein
VTGIEGVTLNGGDDTWRYRHESGGLYTVSANYSPIEKILPLSPTNAARMGVVSKVWGSWAPSKVLVFSQQALLGRLPTRFNLPSRRIIPYGEATTCTWCVGTSELENHNWNFFFLRITKPNGVWYNIIILILRITIVNSFFLKKNNNSW